MIDRRGIPIRVLFVFGEGEDGAQHQSLVDAVTAMRCDGESRTGQNAVLEALDVRAFDVLVLDHQLGYDESLDTLYAARKRGNATPAVVLTNCDHPDAALERLSARIENVEFLNRGRLDISTFERALRSTDLRRSTDLQRVEQRRAVDDSMRFQAHLLDAVEQAVIATDLSGVVTYWNRCAQKLYGWTSGEAVGRNILDVAPSVGVTADAAAVREKLSRAESWSGELKVRHKNGGAFHVWVTNSPILAPGGELMGIVGISIDITERHDADDALRASEAFFRAAFAASAVASVLTSPEETILRVNSAFTTLVQHDEDDLRGLHISTLMHPADAQRSLEMRQRVAAGEIESDQQETRFLRRYGTIVHGLANVAVVRRQDGEPLYYITQVVDISGRIYAEAAVRQREEYLAALVDVQREIAAAPLDALKVMHLIAGRARTLTHATGAIVELIDGDELVSRAADSDSREEQAASRMPLKGSLSGLCVEQRMLLRSADMWNDDRVNQLVARRFGARSGIAVPLMYDGRIVGVLKVHADEREHFGENDERTLQLLAGIGGAALGHAADYAAKQALAAARTAALDALQEREAHFRALIENAADPIIITDERSQIAYASPAVERLFGYTPETLVGTTALGYVHPDDAVRTRESFSRVVANPEHVSSHEMRMKHADGTWCTVKTRSRNLLADPAVGGILVNLTDITAEKLLAQQLRQSQKLEAVGQLAGGVAHDFNNLLTVIQIHGEFLSADIDARDPRHADVDEIQRAATRAAGLTRQLLAFSRQQLLQLKVLDVNAVIASMMPMLGRLIGEDIRVVTSAGVGVLRVLADQGQLEQVLMNLVINARDAMPSGGIIRIDTSIVDLDQAYLDTHGAMVPGRYVLLSVADTGSGMDRRTRERIFEPFFTTKEPGQGTGLGLPTVYGIIKQSNGYVWVYSEPGLGTTFKIYLPLQSDAVPIESGPAATPIPAGTETVLLVEDDEAVRTLARKILLRQGYKVLEARHGVDGLAVSRAFTERIHIVVSDVVMPEMNGRQLVEGLTTERPGIRVLYMSGYTNDDILRRSLLDVGGHRVLQKPFTTAALAQAVRAALDATAIL